MRAYPRRLRIAVLSARKSDKSAREIAEKYRCSESWVRRVVQEHRELAKCGPYKYRFRNRNGGSVYQRARRMIMEDPRITVIELRRVLGDKLSIEVLGGVKDELDVNNQVCWQGGLDTEFVLSPSGNYLLRPRGSYLPWDLEDEIERLKRGEPAIERRVFDTRPIDTTKYPMV